MIMYDGLTTGPSHPQGRAMVRGAVALRKAWTAYTLKRAITDVASMRHEDYRQFGLEKDEILAALERLQDGIERERPTAHTVDSARLAIVVSRRKPRLVVRP